IGTGARRHPRPHLAQAEAVIPRLAIADLGVILSAAKDLLLGRRHAPEILRFAQDDRSRGGWREKASVRWCGPPAPLGAGRGGLLREERRLGELDVTTNAQSVVRVVSQCE